MAQGCGSQSGVIPRDAASATLDGFRVITCVLPAMVVREFTNLSARTPVVTVTVARCQHNTAASKCHCHCCHTSIHVTPEHRIVVTHPRYTRAPRVPLRHTRTPRIPLPLNSEFAEPKANAALENATFTSRTLPLFQPR